MGRPLAPRRMPNRRRRVWGRPRKSRRDRSLASCGGRKEPCGRRRSCWELRSARDGVAGGSDSTSGFRNQDGRRYTVSVACRLSETRAFHWRCAVCAAGANQGIAPRTLAAATYALQLFIERLVEFFLFFLGGRLLIWQHFSYFWLAV